MFYRVWAIACLAMLTWLPVQADILIYNGFVRETETGNGDMVRRLVRFFLVVDTENNKQTLVEYEQQGRTREFVDSYPLHEDWDSTTWAELAGRRGLPTQTLSGLDIDNPEAIDGYQSFALEGVKRRALLYIDDQRTRHFSELARVLRGNGIARDLSGQTLVNRFYLFRLDPLTRTANEGGYAFEDAVDNLVISPLVLPPPAP